MWKVQEGEELSLRLLNTNLSSHAARGERGSVKGSVGIRNEVVFCAIWQYQRCRGDLVQ